MDDAALSFTVDASYAVPPTSDPEVQPRLVSIGRQSIAEYLTLRGPRAYRHDVTRCLVSRRFVLLEGRGVHIASGIPFATFAAGATLATDGLVERYLAFSCARWWPDPPSHCDRRSGSAADVATAVLDALDRRDREQAELLLAPEVVCSVPTGLFGADNRCDLVGRQAVLESWAPAELGEPHSHVVRRALGRGCDAMVAGELADGDERCGSFISTFTTDHRGRVTRVVTFACQGVVPL
jgi:hypothetical protein